MASRNASNIVRILAPSDQLVLEWVTKSFESLDGNVTIQLAGYQNFKFKSKDWLSDSEFMEPLLGLLGDQQGTLISRAILESGKTKSEFDRAVTNYRGTGHHVLLPSLYEAELFFSELGNEANRCDIPIRKAAQGVFQHPSSTDLAHSDYHSALGKEVAQLASISRKIVKQLNDEKIKLSNKFDQERDKIVEKFSEKEKELEVKIEKDEEALEARASELDAREKSLQLQEFKHERREIRNNITKKIQERLNKGRSRSSFLSRIAVLILCALGALIGSGLAYTAAVNGSVSSLLSDGISVGEAIDLFKIVGGGLISITLIFYALNFWRKKVDEDERHERLLERYSLDIDRGSWIVETVLDIRSENPNAEIPDLWLQGVSSGLFPTSSDSAEDKDDAVDALGVLLKKGAHFKLGANGAEFELSEKAAKRVGRDAD